MNKTRAHNINKMSAKKEDQQTRIVGDLQFQFGLKLFHGDVAKKEKMLRATVLILILVVAVIILVVLKNPELADKLIKIIETIVTLSQLIPSLRTAFRTRTNNV